MGQKSGQIASVVDFLTHSVGEKSGQKSSVVEFWTYSGGQKSGQKASIVDFRTYSVGQIGTNIGAKSFSSRILRDKNLGKKIQ